jgi:transposase
MILTAREVRLRPEDRAVLEARCRAATTPQRDVRRARIILLAAEGASTRSISRTVGVEEAVVSTWRNRFADEGLEGLKDRKRSGKPKTYTAETDRRILAVLDEPVPEGYARWTAPLIAERLGDVHEQRIWRVFPDLGHRFRSYALAGKLANLVVEVAKGQLLPDDKLKLISDGARIQIERKGHDPIDMPMTMPRVVHPQPA